MKTLNFGSLCIDNVYKVPYFVRPGETLSCLDYEIHPGGKGLNQSLALAYAGAQVWHAGKTGPEGRWLAQLLADADIDTSLIQITGDPSGHAIIQVLPDGGNAIIISPGANRTLNHHDIEQVFSGFGQGDQLLIQNEINLIPEIIEAARAIGMKIIFNAAPITPEVLDYPLDQVDLLIVNEVEGAALSGEAKPVAMLNILMARYPCTEIVLTLGELGVMYGHHNEIIKQSALPVAAVDSTGAGDTFTGYFVASWQKGNAVEECLKIACRAAALCVTRSGAATSIPKLGELETVIPGQHG